VIVDSCLRKSFTIAYLQWLVLLWLLMVLSFSAVVKKGRHRNSTSYVAVAMPVVFVTVHGAEGAAERESREYAMRASRPRHLSEE
jgi:hypothetical protein